MSLVGSDTLCPCESGLAFAECCGVADRATRQPTVLPPDFTDVDRAPLTRELRAALDQVAARPDLFPARINFVKQRVLWIKMSRRWYDDSVFLDPARIKGSCALETNLAFLEQACERMPWQPTAYIFHTAFCGSTLMSQALAAAYHCLPVREPEVLGNLMYYLRSPAATEADKHAWLDRILRALSRRYVAADPVVVKANDYSNGILLDVLRARADAPLLFMYTPLAEFVVGCLKAENRRAWVGDRYSIVRSLAPQLLNVAQPLELDAQAHAEMAAVYWSYNVAMFLRAWRESPERLRSLDFNRMLADQRASVTACAQQFGLAPLPGVDLAAVIQQLFGVYSKNADFRYSPKQRGNEVARLSTNFAAEIARAEQLSRTLLGVDYPEAGLPGALN